MLSQSSCKGIFTNTDKNKLSDFCSNSGTKYSLVDFIFQHRDVMENYNYSWNIIEQEGFVKREIVIIRAGTDIDYRLRRI